MRVGRGPVTSRSRAAEAADRAVRRTGLDPRLHPPPTDRVRGDATASPRGSIRRRAAGAAAPGVLPADLVYLGAELGEPVFVAGALVGQPGLGVGSFVLDALPGGGQLR